MNIEDVTPEWLAAQESFQNYYLSATPEDTSYWEQWLAEYPDKQQEVASAKAILAAMAAQVSEEEVAAAQRRLVQQLASRRQLSIRRNLWRIAASILFLLGGYWGWMTFQEAPMLTLTTRVGQLDTLQLPDGSTITLNSNTTITYPKDWSTKKRREVTVTGAAYFEIAHQPDRPFVVHTPKGDVEVLGTSFEVSDRQDDFSVTLVEGSVLFRLKQNDIVQLKPSEQLRIKDGALTKSVVETAPIIAWRYDRMEFKNAPIAEIVTLLKEDFGWTIEVKDKSLLQRKITAKIPQNDPQLLLEALSVLYDLEVVKLAKNRYLIQ